jgi:hypothetical protein
MPQAAHQPIAEWQTRRRRAGYFAAGLAGGAGLTNDTFVAGAAFFSAFGFFGSRPLRFWPLAMLASCAWAAPAAVPHTTAS